MPFALIGMVISGIGMLGLLFAINPLIPLILCVAVLPRVFVRSHFAHRQYAYMTSRIESSQLSDHISWLLARPPAAQDVRLFGLGDYLSRRHRELVSEYLQGTQKLTLAREHALFPVGLLSVLGTILSWGIATAQALAGAMSILVGIGANKAIATGQPVAIADLLRG